MKTIQTGLLVPITIASLNMALLAGCAPKPDVAEIKPNVSTSDDVLRIVGAPSMVQRYGRSPNVGWNYGYREAGAWNSMMTVYIDPQGIVRGLENGPDPRYDKDGLFGFGM